MSAVYKKEVRNFLTSMIGYVFIAFLLVVCGIYMTAYHLQAAYPYFSYTLQAVTFVFLIAVPILTMRVLAEERRQKTDQLLLTAPVSVTEIILGKYLALATVFAIPTAVMGFYPLILSQFGQIAFPETYVALLGFFFMGCTFLSIGLYLSSVTESQVIAAVLTFLLLFACYVIEGIASFFPETAFSSYLTLAALILLLAAMIYVMTGQRVIALAAGAILEVFLLAVYLIRSSFFEGLIQQILGVFDLTGHFSEFSGGILDLSAAVYYLSVIVVFLFFTVQSVQKRRWS